MIQPLRKDDIDPEHNITHRVSLEFENSLPKVDVVKPMDNSVK
jgi:hypothetical protein